jgi:very-short-patch-repair endonuclease
MRWLPESVAVTGLAACTIYGLLDTAPAHIRASAPSPLHVRSPAWLTLRRCIVPSSSRDYREVRIVSIPEALVHAWEEDPDDKGRGAIFTALRKGKTTVAAIREAVNYYPHVKHRRRLLGFLAHLLDGMHSFLEYTGARTVLNTPDLRGLEYQVKFVIEGNVFYVDRFHRASRTAVEFDGAAHHSKPEDRAHDEWRDALLARVGVKTVHLPYADVMHHPERCRALVRETIAARASPP